MNLWDRQSSRREYRKVIMESGIPSDPYHPKSDEDILGQLVKGKGRIRRSRAKKVKSKGMSIRNKLALVAITGIVVMVAITFGVYKAMVKTDEFFGKYYLARHKVVEMKFSWPITVEEKQEHIAYIPVTTSGEVKLGKKLTQEEKEQVVANSNYSEVVSRIWMLESEQGRNDNPTAHHNECSNVGLSNEFGFMALQDYCFGSFEESVEVVSRYIGEQLLSKTLPQALCYYNQGAPNGTVSDTCQYVQDYFTLAKSDDIALR